MTATGVTERGSGHAEIVLGFERVKDCAGGGGIHLSVVVEHKEHVAGRTGQTVVGGSSKAAFRWQTNNDVAGLCY
jgi:hypothetical protein